MLHYIILLCSPIQPNLNECKHMRAFYNTSWGKRVIEKPDRWTFDTIIILRGQKTETKKLPTRCTIFPNVCTDYSVFEAPTRSVTITITIRKITKTQEPTSLSCVLGGHATTANDGAHEMHSGNRARGRKT